MKNSKVIEGDYKNKNLIITLISMDKVLYDQLKSYVLESALRLCFP